MKIAVLCGGLSNERDVSLSSGTCVAKALRSRGHNVVLIDMFYGVQQKYKDPKELYELDWVEETYSVGEAAPNLEQIRREISAEGKGIMGNDVIAICREADMTFLALHGDEGENGCVQAALDIAGIRYTGTGCLGSAIAMNKHITKALFREAGIPTPNGICLEKGNTPYGNIGFPCVVKPCSGGSSVGISIVENESDYLNALDEAFKYEENIIVEEYIKGRELTVGIMGGRAMPVVEILPKTGFYDYKNKYQPGLTDEICPANIDEETEANAKKIAVASNKALMLDVYSRADLIWNESDNKMYCLEMNTLPGMTPTSLLPLMAKTEGMTYGELCEEIIELSIKKYEK